MKSALTIIRDEHQTLSTVMASLQQFARDGRERGGKPDFPLLRVTVNFLDVFSGRLHHPREDAHVFSVLRDKISAVASVFGSLTDGQGPGSGIGGLRHRMIEAGAILEELAAEHRRGAELIGNLQRTLAWYRDGEPHGERAFFAAMDVFASFQRDHLRKEEYIVLPLAESLLSEQERRAIDSAFRAKIDPLVERALGHLSNAMARSTGNGGSVNGGGFHFRPQRRAR